MVNLPQVTLISVDTTPNPEDTIKALYTSMSGITFGSVKLIANKDKVKEAILRVRLGADYGGGFEDEDYSYIEQLERRKERKRRGQL